MDKIRNTISIKTLLYLNFIYPGVIQDRFGNQAILNQDGTIKLSNSVNSLSMNKAARLHNFLINNVDKPVNGWKYWHVDISGEKVQLKNIKDLAHKVYVVNVLEKLLSQL